jgi:hypothetical protein
MKKIKILIGFFVLTISVAFAQSTSTVNVNPATLNTNVKNIGKTAKKTKKNSIKQINKQKAIANKKLKAVKNQQINISTK